MQNNPKDPTPRHSGGSGNVTYIGGGGGSYGSKAPQGFAPRDTLEMSNPSREEIDAKLSATEARIEATVARLESKVDASLAKMDASLANMMAKIDHLPSRWELLITVIGGIVGVVGLTFAALSFGGDRFDSGSQIATQIMETRSLSDENARQIKDVSDRLDALPDKILDAIEKRNRVDQAPGDGGGQ